MSQRQGVPGSGLLHRGKLQLHFLNKNMKKNQETFRNTKDATLLIRVLYYPQQQHLLAQVKSASELLCSPLLWVLIYKGTSSISH